MGLSLRQINHLYEALQDAFTPATFERMLYLQLKEKKSKFDGDGNFDTVILRTIQIANSEGWWQRLVHAALKANGGNEKLRGFVRSYPEYDPAPPENKRALLEKRLAALLEEQKLGPQQPGQPGGSRAVAGAEDTWEEIRQVERALSQLEAVTGARGARHADWRNRLHMINFTEAVDLTRELVLDCRSRCGVLFLLQNSLTMGGEWCVTRVREMLEDWTLDFRHYPIEFTYRSQLNRQGVLDLIARYVDVEPLPGDLDEYSRRIISKICGSVQSGSIVFIELRGWELFRHAQGILDWFVDSFWVPLVRELPAIAVEHSKVKFVVMIISDLPSENVPPTHSCTRRDFSNEKVIELPLQNWTRHEITEWLESFSGLNAQNIDELAGTIYDASANGLPALVYKALDRYLPAER